MKSVRPEDRETGRPKDWKTVSGPTVSGIRHPWEYLTWPNRISLLRLLLVPPFVVLMQHQQDQPVCRYVALGIFVVMALSDAADGFLARRLHVVSRLGAILDPLADKTLIICAAVLLSLPHSSVKGLPLPDWVVVMVVGKDLWVILGFAVLFVLTHKVVVLPTLAGKLATAGQLVMVLAILLSPELNRLGGQGLPAGIFDGGAPRLGDRLAEAMWWTVAGLCALAVIAYTRLGVHLAAEADLNQHRPGGGPER